MTVCTYYCFINIRNSLNYLINLFTKLLRKSIASCIRNIYCCSSCFNSCFYNFTKKINFSSLSNIENFNLSLKQEKPQNSAVAVCKSVELYIPLGNLVNKEEELQKLEKRLSELDILISSIEGKLSNDEFIRKAPENIVEGEKNKLNDCLFVAGGKINKKLDASDALGAALCHYYQNKNHLHSLLWAFLLAPYQLTEVCKVFLHS